MSAKRAKPAAKFAGAKSAGAKSAGAAKSGSNASGAGEPVDIRALDAALRLAATRRWSDIALADIAAEAGLSIGELLPHVASKNALLRLFERRIDAAVLAMPVETDGSIKDRLFDLLMRRFDALGPHRDAVQGILDGLPRDPAAALCLLPSLLQSLRYTADAAGVKTTGPLGPLKIKALAAAYLGTLRIWLKDDSADAAKTMAALDKQLGRLEGFTSYIPAFLKGSHA
jgi:AcrR family transcriptional regulator